MIRRLPVHPVSPLAGPAGKAQSARTTRLVRHQPARGAGYRANVDAIHLAHFASTGPARGVAFDLGAGSGAVGLTLLDLEGAERLVFVEIDAEAGRHARANLYESGWAERAEVIIGDVLDVALQHGGEAQLVVCNPPYVEPGRGRSPVEPRRARARLGSLATFVEAARRVAGRRARVCFVYPARELATLMSTLRLAGLEPKRLRAVHARASDPARIVLIEAQAGRPGGLLLEAPLVEIA